MARKSQNLVHGAGLGLRRSFLNEIIEPPPHQIGFYEVAPENWMTIGGKLGKQFRSYDRALSFCLSWTIAIHRQPAMSLTKSLSAISSDFMTEHGIKFYSEHLSYCSEQGHLYDLMPMPFTAEAVKHVAQQNSPSSGYSGTENRY